MVEPDVLERRVADAIETAGRSIGSSAYGPEVPR